MVRTAKVARRNPRLVSITRVEPFCLDVKWMVYVEGLANAFCIDSMGDTFSLVDKWCQSCLPALQPIQLTNWFNIMSTICEEIFFTYETHPKPSYKRMHVFGSTEAHHKATHSAISETDGREKISCKRGSAKVINATPRQRAVEGQCRLRCPWLGSGHSILWHWGTLEQVPTIPQPIFVPEVHKV